MGRLLGVVLLSCCLAVVYTWSKPDMSVYHSTDDLLAGLRAMTDASGGKLARKSLQARSTGDSTAPGVSGTLEVRHRSAVYGWQYCVRE